MRYKELNSALSALIADVPHPLANLANASALLWNSLDDLNWAGFYLLASPSLLVLGPFQGKPACIEIPVGRGVCGTAAERNETVAVPDVHLFPGHIACDSASASEIVVPLRLSSGTGTGTKGHVVGVMDLDSPTPGRFTNEDRAGLERFAAILSASLPPAFPSDLIGTVPN